MCLVARHRWITDRLEEEGRKVGEADGGGGELAQRLVSLISHLPRQSWMRGRAMTRRQKGEKKLQRKTLRIILHPHPHPSLSHATPSLFFPPLRFRKVKVALLFAPFSRLNSSNMQRKIVCKCRLWFRLMYLGYEVPLNERASSSPPVKAWQSTFAGQWTPCREDNRKKLFFLLWDEVIKEKVGFFFQRLCRPSPARSLLERMRGKLSSANWVMADCWSVSSLMFFLCFLCFSFLPSLSDETSRKLPMFLKELGWSWIFGWELLVSLFLPVVVIWV